MRSMTLIALGALLGGCGLAGSGATSSMATRFDTLAHDAYPSMLAPVPKPGEDRRAPTLPTAAPGADQVRLADGGSSAAAEFSGIDMAGVLQVQADDPGAQAEGWQFLLRPYLWLPTVKGSVTIKGNKARFDITQGEIVDHVRFGVLLSMEARNDEMFVLLDTIYLDLKDDPDIPGVPGGELDIRVNMTMIELDTGAAVYEDAVQRVDVLGGLRYWKWYGRVGAKGVGGVPTLSNSVDWVDPIVGARYQLSFAEDWELDLRADYGGFGVGSASDSTYQLLGLSEYHATERLHLGAGWRYLVFDHSQGSGGGRSAQHVRMSGPIAGLMFRF